MLARSRRAFVAVLIAVLALSGVGCSPLEVMATLDRAGHPVTLEQATAIARHTTTCHEAVDMLWPASSRAWAHRIVNRESGGNRFAANRHSTARGCLQTMMSLHGPKYPRVGCTPQQWSDAVCNIRVSLILFDGGRGRSHWALTDH